MPHIDFLLSKQTLENRLRIFTFRKDQFRNVE